MVKRPKKKKTATERLPPEPGAFVCIVPAVPGWHIVQTRLGADGLPVPFPSEDGVERVVVDFLEVASWGLPAPPNRFGTSLFDPGSFSGSPSALSWTAIGFDGKALRGYLVRPGVDMKEGVAQMEAEFKVSPAGLAKAAFEAWMVKDIMER